MPLELVVGLVVVVAYLAFSAGCWWNSAAYHRGFVDGLALRRRTQ
jgi:hypothetical protein